MKVRAGEPISNFIAGVIDIDTDDILQGVIVADDVLGILDSIALELEGVMCLNNKGGQKKVTKKETYALSKRTKQARYVKSYSVQR